MLTLIWWILSLCKVCSFSWLPVLIDSIIGVVLFFKRSFDSFDAQQEDLPSGLCAFYSLGIAAFAFYKLFFSMTISAWWILLSPIVFILLLIIPGGLTIFNLITKNHGLLILPTWGLVVGIILDVLLIVFTIVIIVDEKKRR